MAKILQHKKGILIGTGILLALILYFRPISFPDLSADNIQILIGYNELGVKDGEAYIHSKTCDELPAEQKEMIAEIMRQYTYKRTWKTPFSDGSMQDMHQMLYLHVFDGEQIADGFILSDQKELTRGQKEYRMKDAEELMEKILEAVGENWKENEE